jgi:hypothetical protein
VIFVIDNGYDKSLVLLLQNRWRGGKPTTGLGRKNYTHSMREVSPKKFGVSKEELSIHRVAS